MKCYERLPHGDILALNDITDEKENSEALYEFSETTITKYHKRGGLKQQACIAFQFWRPEVWSQVGGRAVLLLKALGKDLLRMSPLASGGALVIFGILWFIQLYVHLHVAFSLCVSVSKCLLFIFS